MKISDLLLALDAGHGFENTRSGVYDPGATSGTYTEAEIAMQWVETFKFRAVQRGVRVHLIRTGKTDSNPVGKRAAEAKAVGATHYLSIHCNSADSKSATGTETFYRDAGDKGLAVAVHAAALAALGLKDRGLKAEGESQHTRLAVLNFVPPACLLELGFISNPADRTKMLDKSVRIAFADAVLDYLTALVKKG